MLRLLTFRWPKQVTWPHKWVGQGFTRLEGPGSTWVEAEGAAGCLGLDREGQVGMEAYKE